MSNARHWVELPTQPAASGVTGRGRRVRTCPASARRAAGHAARRGRGSEVGER